MDPLWFSLPREAQFRVALFVSPDELTETLPLVCKDFNELCSDPFLWKTIIQNDFCVPQTYLNNVEKKSVNWKSEFQVLTLWKKRIGSNQLRLRPEDTTLANQSAPRRVTYTSLNYEDDNACLAVQSLLPALPLVLGDFSVSYYEIKILNIGDKGSIGIGYALPNCHRGMPGWGADSYGVHGDEGTSFVERGFGTEFMDKWQDGDIIGAGINFKRNEIFITQNGVFIGVITQGIRRVRHLVPTIGMASLGESIEVNFGAEKFAFDLLDWMATEEMDRKLKEKESNESADFFKAVVDMRDLWPVDITQEPTEYLDGDDDDEVPARYRKYSEIAPLFMNTDYLLKEEFISHDLSDIHYNSNCVYYGFGIAPLDYMSESDEEDVPEEESSKPPEHFYKRMLALLDGLCSSVDFLGDETLMNLIKSGDTERGDVATMIERIKDTYEEYSDLLEMDAPTSAPIQEFVFSREPSLPPSLITRNHRFADNVIYHLKLTMIQYYITVVTRIGWMYMIDWSEVTDEDIRERGQAEQELMVLGKKFLIFLQNEDWEDNHKLIAMTSFAAIQLCNKLGDDIQLDPTMDNEHRRARAVLIIGQAMLHMERKQYSTFMQWKHMEIIKSIRAAGGIVTDQATQLVASTTLDKLRDFRKYPVRNIFSTLPTDKAKIQKWQAMLETDHDRHVGIFETFFKGGIFTGTEVPCQTMEELHKLCAEHLKMLLAKVDEVPRNAGPTSEPKRRKTASSSE